MNIEQINSSQKRLDIVKQNLKYNFRKLFNFDYKNDDDLADSVIDSIIDCAIIQVEINQCKMYLEAQKQVINQK